jgi:DNA (cytosine-5)-methyltransferase 1
MSEIAEICNHETREYTGIVLERLQLLPEGGKMGDLPERLQHESFLRTGAKKTGGPNMRLYRLEMDVPSLTVTAYIFNKFVHPVENRYITQREAAVLQDFPLDWEFKGTKGQVQKQIGNAVPVKLAKAIATSVGTYLTSIGIGGNVNIASFFSGAGGLDLGFEEASNENINFSTVFSNDIEKWAESTVNCNRPEWNFLCKDIRDVTLEDITSKTDEDISVVIGGPPCQPFSVAGKQKATEDPLGRLYSDFIRQVNSLKPEIVVMENVYGLAQVKSANMIELIYNSYEKIGYEVKHNEMLSADFGTPQKRRRLIFVATRLKNIFQFPDPTHSKIANLLGLPLHNGAGKAILGLPEAMKK